MLANIEDTAGRQPSNASFVSGLVSFLQLYSGLLSAFRTGYLTLLLLPQSIVQFVLLKQLVQLICFQQTAFLTLSISDYEVVRLLLEVYLIWWLAIRKIWIHVLMVGTDNVLSDWAAEVLTLFTRVVVGQVICMSDQSRVSFSTLVAHQIEIGTIETVFNVLEVIIQE